MPRICYHECCEQRDNPNHVHTIEPVDCLQCNHRRYGRPWIWTDDPGDPCWVCAIWNGDTPHNSYGDILPRVCCEAHDECLEVLNVVRCG